ALLLSPFGNRLADLFRASHTAAGLGALASTLRGAGRRQGFAGCVVNHLGVNMVERTVDVEPRPFRRTLHPLPQALVNPPANFVFRNLWNHVVTLCFVEPSAPRSKLLFRSPDDPITRSSDCGILRDSKSLRMTAAGSDARKTRSLGSRLSDLLLQSLAQV